MTHRRAEPAHVETSIGPLTVTLRWQPGPPDEPRIQPHADSWATAHALARAATAEDHDGMHRLLAQLYASGDLGELTGALQQLALITGVVITGLSPESQAGVWSRVAEIGGILEADRARTDGESDSATA